MSSTEEAYYVVKPAQIAALNHLSAHCPKPLSRIWINRGTGQPLRPSSIEMLMRTLYVEDVSSSVIRLREEAGLKLCFRNEDERYRFSIQIEEAEREISSQRETHVTAVFDLLADAQQAIASLLDHGVDENAVSMMWRASLFLDHDIDWRDGHRVEDVTSTIVGGGVAGLALSLGMVLLPGLGPVVAAGAALSGLTTIGGVAGATGIAIAKALTDADVDDVAAKHYARQITKGKILVSIRRGWGDLNECDLSRICVRHGGVEYKRR